LEFPNDSSSLKESDNFAMRQCLFYHQRQKRR